jgi:hypothetical protein
VALLAGEVRWSLIAVVGVLGRRTGSDQRAGDVLEPPERGVVQCRAARGVRDLDVCTRRHECPHHVAVAGHDRPVEGSAALVVATVERRAGRELLQHLDQITPACGVDQPRRRDRPDRVEHLRHRCRLLGPSVVLGRSDIQHAVGELCRVRNTPFAALLLRRTPHGRLQVFEHQERRGEGLVEVVRRPPSLRIGEQRGLGAHPPCRREHVVDLLAGEHPIREQRRVARLEVVGLVAVEVPEEARDRTTVPLRQRDHHRVVTHTKARAVRPAQGQVARGAAQMAADTDHGVLLRRQLPSPSVDDDLGGRQLHDGAVHAGGHRRVGAERRGSDDRLLSGLDLQGAIRRAHEHLLSHGLQVVGQPVEGQQVRIPAAAAEVLDIARAGAQRPRRSEPRHAVDLRALPPDSQARNTEALGDVEVGLRWLAHRVHPTGLPLDRLVVRPWMGVEPAHQRALRMVLQRWHRDRVVGGLVVRPALGDRRPLAARGLLHLALVDEPALLLLVVGTLRRVRPGHLQSLLHRRVGQQILHRDVGARPPRRRSQQPHPSDHQE